MIGVDVDEVAIDHAQRNLHPILSKKRSLKAHFLKGNFRCCLSFCRNRLSLWIRDLPNLMVSNQPPLGHFLNEGIDGILMDLGMSSLQVVSSF